MTGYRRCVEQRERESSRYFTNMSKVQVGSLLSNIAVQVLAPSHNLLLFAANSYSQQLVCSYTASIFYPSNALIINVKDDCTIHKNSCYHVKISQTSRSHFKAYTRHTYYTNAFNHTGHYQLALHVYSDTPFLQAECTHSRSAAESLLPGFVQRERD